MRQLCSASLQLFTGACSEQYVFFDCDYNFHSFSIFSYNFIMKKRIIDQNQFFAHSYHEDIKALYLTIRIVIFHVSILESFERFRFLGALTVT